MFATLKHLIPEPRQADQPRRYIGKHRQPDDLVAVTTPEGFTPTPVVPGSTDDDVEPIAAAEPVAAEPVAAESSA